MNGLEFDFQKRRVSLHESLNGFLSEWIKNQNDIKHFELSRDIAVVLEKILDEIS